MSITAVLESLAVYAEAINGRPGGVGHLLHIAPDPISGTPGFVVKCAGAQQEGGDEPQHVIGTITKGPTSDDFIAMESPGDAVWILDPSQPSFNPANPVCFCGKRPII
jgi:hypothetical protein